MLYDFYPKVLVELLLYLLLEGSKDGDRHSLNTFCLYSVSIVSIEYRHRLFVRHFEKTVAGQNDATRKQVDGFKFKSD